MIYSIIITDSISVLLGKCGVFCEVTMGAQKNRTKVVPATSEVQWNATMQFLIKDLQEDVLCITVFDRGHFSPNGERINIMKFFCAHLQKVLVMIVCMDYYEH